MKKYEFTGETKIVAGVTLKRIRALVSFGDVVKGEVGGFIKDEKNLSHNGNAWVADNVWVTGDADYMLIGRIGSRNDFTTFFKNKGGGISVKCGCFCGTIAEFRERVKKNLRRRHETRKSISSRGRFSRVADFRPGGRMMDLQTVLNRLDALIKYIEYHDTYDERISAFVLLRYLRKMAAGIDCELSKQKTQSNNNQSCDESSDGSAATAKHYQIDGARLQPVEMLQDILTPEEFRGWLKGSMFKYFCRAGKKPGEPYERDMAKCLQFNEWLKQAAAGKKINPRE